MTTTIQDKDTRQARPSGGADDGPASRLASVRESAADAYQTARERTNAAYTAARERASRVSRRTADEVDANPMIALAGGLVLGALAAALLPKTRREEKLLGTAGRRITDTAREASRAAREAGREQLDALGISREAALRKLDEFSDRAVSAVESSASAVAKKVKNKRQK